MCRVNCSPGQFLLAQSVFTASNLTLCLQHPNYFQLNFTFSPRNSQKLCRNIPKTNCLFLSSCALGAYPVMEANMFEARGRPEALSSSLTFGTLGYAACWPTIFFAQCVCVSLCVQVNVCAGWAKEDPATN